MLQQRINNTKTALCITDYHKLLLFLLNYTDPNSLNVFAFLG